MLILNLLNSPNRMSLSEWIISLGKSLLWTAFVIFILSLGGWGIYSVLNVIFDFYKIFNIQLYRELFEWILIATIGIIYLGSLYACHNVLFNNRLAAERKELKRREVEVDKEKEKLEKDIKDFGDQMVKHNLDLEEKKKKIMALLSSKSPFKESASMISDIQVAIFKDSENYLRTKRRPAPIAAAEVKRMGLILQDQKAKSNEINYKLEYILSSFPEIQQYVDNDQDLLAIGERASYTELMDSKDRRLDYLSKGEYLRLSESQKSQLALDRYLAGRKTKWQIGRDYEMCCAFELKKQGYSVEMHGIKYGLEDLGRDLIARKSDISVREILIIQCKNWNSERLIRENVIMQLYGSATAFAIETNLMLNKDIFAILMIPDHSHISDTAMAFANKLGIKIVRQNKLDFPHIKCNINHGEKIYHLPFDQLYDQTEICNNGERYAYTVAEAEAHGFRRAKRHNWH